MKLKFKLSLMVIAILVVVVATVAVVLLNQSSGLAVELNTEAVDFFGSWRAAYWGGREDGLLQVLRVIAALMSDYENVPTENRRDQFENIMSVVLQRNPNFITIYTVWKPDAVDGMDSRFIGSETSTPTGQFAAQYTKETGTITARTTSDVEGSMAYFNGPQSKNERVLAPEARTVNGRDTFVLRYMVPIINPRTNETDWI